MPIPRFASRFARDRYVRKTNGKGHLKAWEGWGAATRQIMHMGREVAASDIWQELVPNHSSGLVPPFRSGTAPQPRRSVHYQASVRDVDPR
eukprot:gene10819-biopygen15748